MRYFLFIVASALACWAGFSEPTAASSSRVHANFYFIDAHSQFDHEVDTARVISLMDHGGVYRTILSSHRHRSWRDITAFAKSHPDRIVPAVRIKGRGYHRGRARRFYKRLQAQSADPAFKAMAEVHIWHDGLGRFHEIKTDFDDELVKAAFGKAKEKGWPFIVHIEFASLETDDQREYVGKLEAFLEANPNHAVLLIHMGQLEAGAVHRLLAAHKNLHFMTSHASPFYENGRKPFINMLDGNNLKPEWKRLMVKFPDRFIFALDNVFSHFWTEQKYLGKMEMWWKAVADLPPAVAHAFAHGNAERLWKLKPRKRGMDPPWVAQEKLGEVKGEASEERPGRRRGRRR